MTVPAIAIYVRHSNGCKYSGDEYARRCDCRKHLRWTDANGKQQRVKTGQRSWTEAEKVKRRIEAELSGEAPVKATGGKLLIDAIDVFIRDKEVQGLSADVIGKYKRGLDRLRNFCERRRVLTVQGIDRELITEFCVGWPTQYPSTITRSKLREQYKSFLRYCYEAQWLDRIPVWPKVRVEDAETQPLTPEEFTSLLAAIPLAVAAGDPRRKTEANNGRRSPDEEDLLVQKVRAFVLTMRWSGLAMLDTLTLPKTALHRKDAKKLYVVTTKRKKTGVDVSIPIPWEVGQALEAEAKQSPSAYFFWSGEGRTQSAATNWGQRYIAPAFKLAGLHGGGFMVSHRLRDTFAVDLLEKGVPMEEVSKLLGHESIRTTEKHYAKWSKGRQDRLESLVTATWS